MLKTILLFVAIYIMSVGAATAATEVISAAFCMGRGSVEPTCERPIPPGVSNIKINQLETDDAGNYRLWIWSSISVSEDENVMYVFSSDNNKIKWAETIHMHWLDRAIEIGDTILSQAKDILRIVYKADPSVHDVQGTGFVARAGSRNRWPVNIAVIPGTYSFEIVDFSGEVIKGGEKRTITVTL